MSISTEKHSWMTNFCSGFGCDAVYRDNPAAVILIVIEQSLFGRF
ncbi:MAG: hypothetical protein AAFQ91_06630 [Cyanobacteria bacterium J06621_15]